VNPDSRFEDPHEEAAAGRLRWAILVDEIAAALGAISIALLYLVVVRNLWLLSLVVPVGGLSIALRLARRELDRGDTSRAVTIHAIGNWVVGVSVTFVVPFIWPILMLTVLMPLVLAVPHVRRSQLVTLITASVGVVVAVSLLGLTQMTTGITGDVSPWIRNTVVISALAAVFIIIVVIVWQTHAQNEAILLRVLATNADLARSERELAEQAVLLRDSRARLASVADRERRRIERDLHDGAQQRLVGLAVRLGLLSTQLDESHAATVDTMKDEISSAIEELRELAHGIYPPLLAKEGLAVALQAAARRSPLPTRVLVDQLARYTPDIENALYFCCLEALQNAAKHAGDDASIVIGLHGGPSTVELRVTDDGRGFPSTTVESGNGILNMLDRVGAVGGTVEIGPLDGGGVEVSATVPATARAGS
jgi:signal transduction histidine kinase